VFCQGFRDGEEGVLCTVFFRSSTRWGISMDGCSYSDMISACHLPSFSFCDDSSVYCFQALKFPALPVHSLLCAASNPRQFLPPDPPPPRPGFLTPEKDLSLSSIIVCPARCPLAEPTVVVVPLLSPSIAAPAMVVLGQQRSKAKGRLCQESSDSRDAIPESLQEARGRPSTNKQRCTRLENLRKKSELSSTWYHPSGRAGVAGSLQSQQLS
jgi:hypothetical protein